MLLYTHALHLPGVLFFESFPSLCKFQTASGLSSWSGFCPTNVDAVLLSCPVSSAANTMSLLGLCAPLIQIVLENDLVC